MTMGMVTSSTMTPRRVAMKPGERELRDDDEQLHDGVEAGEHLRARGELLELLLHQLELLEVQERVDGRDADDEQRDATQVRIAQHQHETRERDCRPARDRAPKVARTRRRAGRRMRRHCTMSRRCRTMAMRYMPAPKYSTPELPMLFTNKRRGSRTEERAQRAARGDESEQPLRLLARDDLEHEAPEHRDQQQVHDADRDVEHARDHRVRRVAPEYLRGHHERHGHESVDGRQQDRAANAPDQPAIERHDQDARTAR